jgi:hypothetical protein
VCHALTSWQSIARQGSSPTSTRLPVPRDREVRSYPNDWCDEHDDPTYIVDLIKKITTVRPCLRFLFTRPDPEDHTANGRHRLPNHGFGGYPQLAFCSQNASWTAAIERVFDIVGSWVPPGTLFP